MNKLIITMCGTSALFECLPDWRKRDERPDWKNRKDLIRDLIEEQLNGKEREYNYLKERAIETLQRNLKCYNLKSGRSLDRRRLSAEIASLLAMEKDNKVGTITEHDRIILFRSDTIDGKLCSEVNKEVIENCDTLNKQWVVDITKIDQLQTENAAEFVEGGLDNLVKEIYKKKNSHPESKMIFNITCGYKGTIPIFSKLSMDMKVPLVYLFESSNDIIRMDISGEYPVIYTIDSASGKTEKKELTWPNRSLE